MCGALVQAELDLPSVGRNYQQNLQTRFGHNNFLSSRPLKKFYLSSSHGSYQTTFPKHASDSEVAWQMRPLEKYFGNAMSRENLTQQLTYDIIASAKK